MCGGGGEQPEIRISCKLQSRKGGSWSWKWSMSYMHTDIPQGQKLGAPNIHILNDRLCSHHSCSEQEAGKFCLLTPTYTTASKFTRRGENNPPFPFPSLLHEIKRRSHTLYSFTSSRAIGSFHFREDEERHENPASLTLILYVHGW